MNYSPPIEERQAAVSGPHAWHNTTHDWAFIEFGAIVALVIGGIGLVVFAVEMILR